MDSIDPSPDMDSKSRGCHPLIDDCAHYIAFHSSQPEQAQWPDSYIPRVGSRAY